MARELGKGTRLRKEKVRGGFVDIGFFSNASYADGMKVASVAATNEFGTSKQPPRPFFRRMINSDKGNWGRVLARSMVTGREPSTALSLLGEHVSGQLRRSIVALVSPPLSPVTIAKKGFSKPLIDTGHMINSISYRIKD